MAKPKFSDQELKRPVRRGHRLSEIADKLGVSRAAVSMRLKALDVAITQNVTLVNAGEIVDKELDAADQLRRINKHAHEVIDSLAGAVEDGEITLKDAKEISLKACAEVRKQLSLQLQIFESLYNMQSIAAFQNEVLDAIASVAPEVRDRIVSTLQERKAIRSSLELSI